MKNYNRHIFDIIDTPEKAYWLGFIVADGYLNIDRRMLRIKLGNIDKQHLIKYIEFLDGDIQDMLISDTHNITCNSQWYVTTYCKEIRDALVNLSVRQAKSGNEHIPQLPQNLYRDFIRGLWDGDGFIRKNLKGIGLVGSYECLKFVQDYFKEQLNIKPLKIYNHYNTYKIEYRSTKKAIPLIINHLYQENDICLDRKKLLADQIKKLC